MKSVTYVQRPRRRIVSLTTDRQSRPVGRKSNRGSANGETAALLFQPPRGFTITIVLYCKSFPPLFRTFESFGSYGRIKRPEKLRSRFGRRTQSRSPRGLASIFGNRAICENRTADVRDFLDDSKIYRICYDLRYCGICRMIFIWVSGYVKSWKHSRSRDDSWIVDCFILFA